MGLKKIAVLDDYQGLALELADWSPLAGRAEVTVFRDHIDDPDRLVERLQPFHVVCVMRERTPLPGAILQRLPSLKLIVSTGPANASIDLDAAKVRGVLVCNTGHAGAGAKELTWALILAAVRGLPRELASMHSGGWQVGLGGDLKGKTLGVLGLGRIGTEVARVAQAFDMRVIAWSQNLTPERAGAAGAVWVPKEALFREADVVTLHLKLSERSRHIVAASELGLMQSTAWLVNTSRGPLVDESALLAALDGKRIGGVALDVYDHEPLPADHPFRRLANVIATPHVGFVTRDAYTVFYRDTVENILAWLDGSPIRLA